MPHGRLTPLGRELHSVVFNLRVAPVRNGTGFRSSCPGGTLLFQKIHGPINRRDKSNAAALASREEIADGKDGPVDNASHPGPISDQELYKGSQEQLDIAFHRPTRKKKPDSRLRLNRRTRVDRITEALQKTSNWNVLPKPAHSSKKQNISHTNLWSSDGRARQAVNAERHRNDPIPPLEHATELKLSRILASYILYSSHRDDSTSKKYHESFSLSRAEKDLVRREGFTLEDIAGWANLIGNSDSLEVAIALWDRSRKEGPSAVPFFLLAYVLRRQHIGQRSLRRFIKLTNRVLDHRTSPGAHITPLTSNAVFLVLQRLLRHARIVWPWANYTVAGMLLKYLPRTLGPSSQHPHGAIHILTFQLNRAMSLFSIPAPVEPFKARRLQRTAVVRILTFMAEHDPPLDVNREGHRALVAIQLSEQKTYREQEWAMLKSPAWPPWKVERTAMDAYITHDKHGISKAAETLQRLQQGGYGFRNWETSAMVSAGWDIDGTPTIQTRTLAPVKIGRHYDWYYGGSLGIWAVRIQTTRTVQEAWACYLAFENERRSASRDYPIDSDTVDQSLMSVYLAIFQKLHEEEKRLSAKETRTPTLPEHAPTFQPLYPGDRPEIDPPPFSLHQHTYTRRPPPTVDELYLELRANGVSLDGRCLAFVVAHAASMKAGMQYLFGSVSQYPEIRGLVSLDKSIDLSALPIPLVAAYLELLKRFSRVPISSALPEDVIDRTPPTGDLRGSRSGVENVNHPLILACELLNRLRPLYQPAWISVLSALGHESSLLNLWRPAKVVGETMLRAEDSVKADLAEATEEENLRLGAMTAYRLARRLHDVMGECHLELDAVGFQAWCNTFENAFVAWRMIMQEDKSAEQRSPRWPFVEAKSVLRVMKFDRIDLKNRFATLVGETAKEDKHEEEEHTSDAFSDLELLRLRNPPGPSVMHAYIRILGWTANYDDLIATVRWMVEFQDELAEKRARDRNGEVMMRRALTAVRVFLERSWLNDRDAKISTENLSPGKEETVSWHFTSTRTQFFESIEKPAAREIIDEARVMIDRVKGWGGWPTDDDVERYCQHHAFQRMLGKVYEETKRE